MMDFDQLIHIDYNWTDLIFLTIVLVAIYAILIFTKRVISGISWVGRLRSTIKKIVNTLVILYEPLSILIVISVFVMIKPAFHGLIVGIIGVVGFSHLRNYFHSRLIQTGKALKTGRRIRVLDQVGIITDLGRLGIQIRSDDGLHYIPYHELVSRGFVLSSGDKIGGYYNLQVDPKDEEHIDQDMQRLSNILISSPYVDGDYKPEISRSITLDGKINVRLLVKEESHIHDLMSLLEENDFMSVITKS